MDVSIQDITNISNDVDKLVEIIEKQNEKIKQLEHSHDELSDRYDWLMMIVHKMCPDCKSSKLKHYTAHEDFYGASECLSCGKGVEA